MSQKHIYSIPFLIFLLFTISLFTLFLTLYLIKSSSTYAFTFDYRKRLLLGLFKCATRFWGILIFFFEIFWDSIHSLFFCFPYNIFSHRSETFWIVLLPGLRCFWAREGAHSWQVSTGIIISAAEKISLQEVSMQVIHQHLCPSLQFISMSRKLPCRTQCFNSPLPQVALVTLLNAVSYFQLVLEDPQPPRILLLRKMTTHPPWTCCCSFNPCGLCVMMRCKINWKLGFDMLIATSLVSACNLLANIGKNALKEQALVLQPRRLHCTSCTMMPRYSLFCDQNAGKIFAILVDRPI